MESRKWLQARSSEEFYEKAQAYADRHFGGNLSELIRDALRAVIEQAES